MFVDQAYWMGAIASKPSASYKGYILGGLMWFCIPFTLATSLGLASVAMDLPITREEASAGLVPPATAVYILGNSGAIWVSCVGDLRLPCNPDDRAAFVGFKVDAGVAIPLLVLLGADPPYPLPMTCRS